MMRNYFRSTAAALSPAAAVVLRASLTLALMALMAPITRPVQAQTAEAAKAAPASADDASKAEMEAYLKLAQPGEHHKRLGDLAGKWKVAGKSWMAPGQPPMEMSGSMEASWILGGRYLQESHKATFMGQPFEGRSLDGYDNATHQYWSTWVDSFGTGVLLFKGTCDDPCHVLTETAEALDVRSGKMAKTKTVTTFVDPNTYRFEMYMVGAGSDGGDLKVMELISTRLR